MKQTKLFSTLTLFLTLFSYNCDIFNTQFEDLEDAVMYEASTITEAPTEVEALNVMTWNLKFGGARIDFWFDCYGDRVLMTENEVMDNIDSLAIYINQVNPDIVLLQEVDVNSKRSAYIDQLQYLLENTELNYGAYASQWKADFIPSDGLGKMDSGNAIMSRWPINNAERIALPLISEDDALTQYFYLKRNILKAKIQLPNVDNIWAMNVHTSAYSHDGTKQTQLNMFKDELDLLQDSGATFIAGGDFNSLPPWATQTNNFDDSICEDEDFQGDDYSDETDWLDEFYNDYLPAVTSTEYVADEESYFTHTVQGPPDGFWSRKLDYLFTNQSWIVDSDSTHQNTMNLSDHAPLTSTLNLSEED